ncbi:MAG: hypothetical protein IJ444_08580 [Kiritimatiellae bacterium]|nr:hypothetical protein [Kiritimatiellia bacterium]
MKNKVKFPIAAIFFIPFRFFCFVMFYEILTGFVRSYDEVWYVYLCAITYLFLFVTLCARKRNILLVLANLGVLLCSLVEFIGCCISYRLSDENYWFEFIVFLLNLLASILIFVYAIFLREREKVSEKIEKASVWCRRCFFLPGLILLISQSLMYYVWFILPKESYLKGTIKNNLIDLTLYMNGFSINIFIFLAVAYWMAFPYKKSKIEEL